MTMRISWNGFDEPWEKIPSRGAVEFQLIEMIFGWNKSVKLFELLDEKLNTLARFPPFFSSANASLLWTAY